MEFIFQRRYRGPLQAAILDWAGTTIDYGCFAPAVSFVKAFAKHGVSITDAHARAPMGLAKKDHVRAITQMPAIAAQWQKVHGAECTERDINVLYQESEAILLGCLTDYAELIPGVVETIQQFRVQGLKIGSTTGYTRAMMSLILPQVRERDYAPDAVVCPDEVGGGRPYPWMCYQNMQRLGVYPAEAVVKIGDTIPDIEEGLNAGLWVIGVIMSSNEMGLHPSELAKLEPTILERRRTEIAARMYRAGSHYVVNNIVECTNLIVEINARLARGERP